MARFICSKKTLNFADYCPTIPLPLTGNFQLQIMYLDFLRSLPLM